MHREFSSAYPATMTIYKDVVVTENWNRPYMMGRISLENLKPHPKNPTIANFFKQLGWVEELGSGIRKMYKYCPIYVKDALPVIEEGDVFKLTIRHEPLNEINEINEPLNEPLNEINEPLNEPLNVYEISLISYLKERPGANRNDIENTLDISLATLKRTINTLQKKNLIERIGSRKTGGYYLITKRKQDNSK